MDYLTQMHRPAALNVMSNALEPLGVVETYSALTIHPTLYGLGSFEFTSPLTGQLSQLIQRDRIVEFGTGGQYAGIIVGRDKSLSANGVQIRVFGTMLNGLMRRRMAVPSDDPALLGWDVSEGTVGHIMAHYVTDHAINPSNPIRALPHLRLADDIESVGMLTVAKARFDVLSDVLTSLAQYSGVGWRISIVDGFYEFQALAITDRTESSADPLILSTAFQNVLSANSTEDYTDYANAIYALGDGQYENRMRLTVYADDQIVEGWDRYETVADCGNEDSPSRLREVAMQQIEDSRQTDSLTLQLNPHTVGANLGDMAIIFLPEIDVNYDLPITELNIRWQGAHKQLDAVLGSPPRTLTRQLERSRRLRNIT